MCRCSVWITNSGREEFRYLTPKELANKRICELHFEEFMFSNFFKTHLKKNAVPNQFDKVTPEMFQNNDDDDSNDEGESGIASESSSNHNNHDLINNALKCNTDTMIGDDVIEPSMENGCSVVYGEETTSHNKRESIKSIHSSVKDLTRSLLNSRNNDFLSRKSTTKQNVRL